MFFKLLAFFLSAHAGAKPDCHYSTWTWDTKTRKTVQHERVAKNKKELSKEEKDPYSKCTVCEEDQISISMNGVGAFKICRHFAEPIKKILEEARRDGFPLIEVIGYRVGKSKGAADKNGLRTKFSHHSFGSAIDINPNFNGLYDNCNHFGPDCILLRGGRWNASNSASITKNSLLYLRFKKMGWKWGGELQGKQKDFMHFSKMGD